MSIHTYQEVFLNPGESYFGEGHLRLSTLLGSCVSISLWHPLRKHGGMCHYMLDSRGSVPDKLCGKYADEAMAIFMAELGKRKTHPSEYEVKIFGGGNMFGSARSGESVLDIGTRNIEAADQLLDRHGFNQIRVRHVGGYGHRRLMFDLWNGNAWVKFQSSAPSCTFVEA
jgi:chemotaxis protein CheD